MPPAAPSGPTTELLTDRIRRAGEVAAEQGVDLLAITPGTDLRYLLDSTAESHERLTCLLVPAAGHQAPPALVVPRLEAPRLPTRRLEELGIEIVTWSDGEDPHLLVSDLAGAPRTVGVSDAMAAAHVLALRDVLPDAVLTLAGRVLRELRIRKDDAEIAQLRAAGAAIDRVHARMTEFLKAGRTENRIAADIAEAIVAEGHEAAAFVVVGSGPNGASPHHDAGERVVEAGDVVVVDIGGPLPSGYHSDCTRTYAVGGAPAGAVLEAYAALQEAQERAVAAVRPGAVAEQVDAAARGVLTDAGLGELFLHRTGHGIGLDVHEAPDIVTGNALVLEEGMAFSIEPGVYVEGR
ncbi:MAG: Xaa-Pro peptidase family protein, partial [Pseudonocardia sp.]|nr:Xaa-Pro peptidase family protein [Pseudonocardia sp.]